MSCSCCRYKSCDIYAEHHQNENQYFEEHVTGFHHQHYIGGGYKVEPLFEPLEVHMRGNEHMIEELAEKGIDANNCQFLHPKKGCLLGEEKPEWCQNDITICDNIYRSVETPYFKMIKRTVNKTADYITYQYKKDNIECTIQFEVVLERKGYSHPRFKVFDTNNTSVDMRGIVQNLYQKLKNEVEKTPYFRLRPQINDKYSFQFESSWFDSSKKNELMVEQILSHMLTSSFVETYVFLYEDVENNLLDSYKKASDILENTYGIDTLYHSYDNKIGIYVIEKDNE